MSETKPFSEIKFIIRKNGVKTIFAAISMSTLLYGIRSLFLIFLSPGYANFFTIIIPATISFYIAICSSKGDQAGNAFWHGWMNIKMSGHILIILGSISIGLIMTRISDLLALLSQSKKITWHAKYLAQNTYGRFQ